MIDPTIRALVDLRDRTLQKSRIAFGNRASAVESGRDEMDETTKAMIDRWQERFESLEKEADEDIRAIVKDEPIVLELVKLKGIGFLLAAKLVCMIDITRCDTVSSLWRYAGYAVINGERERMVKGEKAHYNQRLKTTCYLVATSFMRAGSPYRGVYDAAKDYYQQSHPDWTNGHRHNAASRKMIKVFLSHLWLRWRQIEGLPISEPYIIGHNGHSHLISPEEYGWGLAKE